MAVIAKKIVAPVFRRYTKTGALFSGTAVITFQEGEGDPEDVVRDFHFEIPATDVEGKTKAQKLAFVKAAFFSQLDAEEARAVAERALTTMGVEALSLPAELP